VRQRQAVLEAHETDHKEVDVGAMRGHEDDRYVAGNVLHLEAVGRGVRGRCKGREITALRPR
jgi:hypothetical protein